MPYDIAIVGAGAAGLTAAIYAARKALKTVIISLDVGGQASMTSHIENYPGFDSISGPELMKRFFDKVIKLGVEFIMAEVEGIEKSNEGFILKLSNGQDIEAKAVILAFGKVPRKLGVPGEDKFFGKGVSTCVTCDAPLYKDKVVAVVGGGNSAVEGALELSNIANKVYLVHRRDAFRADETTVAKLKDKSNIELVLNSVVKEIKGSNKVESIVVENVKTKEQKEIKVDGVFIEIGFESKTEWLKDIVELDEKGQVIIDSLCQTSQQGIFAAGDCTNMPFKQIVISAGQGAIAALMAYQWLTGGKGAIVDWH